LGHKKLKGSALETQLLYPLIGEQAVIPAKEFSEKLKGFCSLIWRYS
jgi:hypothetical protein